MENLRICKKCLLEDINEDKLLHSIKEMINSIPDENRASEMEYRRRLNICKECTELINGTCRKCGCYVELRAAGKERQCPDVKNKWG